MFLNEVVEKYHTNLLTTNSKVALAYLASRGINFDEIKKYKIGYVGSIFKPLEETTSEIKAFNEWTGKNSYAIKHRIIFPIYNELGIIIGIETRALDKVATLNTLTPQYKEKFKDLINRLPENAIRYKKFYLKDSSHIAHIFGIPSALKSIWENEYAFITEGIFDCLSVLKIYPNCISTLTANVNDIQLDWLRRYVKKVIFLFDSDEKGKTAYNKLKYKLKDTFMVYTIGLKGDDVNEMAVKEGINDLKMLIEYKLKSIY